MGWYGYLAHAVEVVGSYGVLLQHILWSALENHLATVHTGTRTDVYYPVGSKHHILVVLYNNHGVAKVAQLLKREDKSLVVALVQTDARLVEDIQHIDKL